jgi:hypothetical protein
MLAIMTIHRYIMHIFLSVTVLDLIKGSGDGM